MTGFAAALQSIRYRDLLTAGPFPYIDAVPSISVNRGELVITNMRPKGFDPSDCQPGSLRLMSEEKEIKTIWNPLKF